MKKFGAFLLAATVATAALPQQAEAIDVNAFGSIFFRAGYINNINYVQDDVARFGMGQNMATYFKFATSENLSLTMLLQATSYGNGYGYDASGYGASVGGFSSEHAIFGPAFIYVDYKTLEDKLALRVGLQSSSDVSYTFGVDQAAFKPHAGVSATYNINDTMRVKFSWFRPSLQIFPDVGTGAAAYNTFLPREGTAIDHFELRVPMAFGNINVEPSFGLYVIGEDVNANGVPSSTGQMAIGQGYNSSMGTLFGSPLTGAQTGTSFSWHVGTTARMNLGDIAIAADFLYGSTDIDQVSDGADRAGFIIGANASYQMDFGRIAAIAWYGSGNDDDGTNGSEQMPISASVFNPASIIGGPWAHDLHFDADTSMALPGAHANTPVGTFSIGAGISSMTFMDGLYHSFWGIYTMGTNDVKNATIYNLNMMTTKDALLQLGTTNWYHLEQNLILRAEAVYGINMYDEDLARFAATATAPTATAKIGKDARNASRVDLSLIYLF